MRVRNLVLVALLAAVVAAGVAAVMTVTRLRADGGTMGSGGAQEQQAPEEQTFGSVKSVPDVYPNGLKVGDGLTKWTKLILGPGQNKTGLTNTTGYLYVDEVVAYTTPTSTNSGVSVVASSSYQFVVGTSTLAWTSLNDFLDPRNGSSQTATNSMIYMPIATGTTATSSASGGYNGRFRSLVLKAGEYLNVALLEGVSGTPSAGCETVLNCESATSTRRGFNMEVCVRTHR